MNPDDDHIASALDAVREQIATTARRCGRQSGDVSLLAVSKTKPASAIRIAHRHGQRCFGESYVQEALAKQQELAGLDIEWHFIGPIQSNKTRDIAAHFDWVHSVERGKIATRLNAQRPVGMPPLNVLLQINVSGESTKSGVAPADARALAHEIALLPNLRLRGLMTVPAPCDDPVAQREPFRQLRELMADLNADGLVLDTLSMGMTHDLDAAVAEGATIVRVGTAIFGAR